MATIRMPRTHHVYSTRGGDFVSDAHGLIHDVLPHTQAYWDLTISNTGRLVEPEIIKVIIDR